MKFAKFVAVIGVVGVLSGCSVIQKADAAAVVGSDRLSMAQVDHEFQAIVAALQGDAVSGVMADNYRTIVVSWAQSEVLAALCKDRGVVVTDKEVADRIAGLVASAGSRAAFEKQAAQAMIAPENITRVIRMSMEFSALQKQLAGPNATDAQISDASTAVIGLLSQKSRELNIDIAPRFGQWNHDTVAGEAATSKWIYSVDQLSAQAQNQ